MMLAVRGLVKEFPRRAGWFGSGSIRALDHFELDVRPGETAALVGESGCGKTTAGRAILGLIRPTAGQVLWDDVDLDALAPAQRRAARRRAQMIFQDTGAALDPRRRIGWSVAEPLLVQGGHDRGRLKARVERLLAGVGLPADAADRFPHEFSGGQRQRIGVARAIALDPELIIADEPTSAQDVSVRARILDLLKELKARRPISYLFISHDLPSVRHFADRVAVMIAGRIVEEAPTRSLFHRPMHPYTQALLAAVPVPEFVERSAPSDSDCPRDPAGAAQPAGGADPPDGAELAWNGCAYAPRCPVAERRCRQEAPSLVTVGEAHKVACHLVAPAPAPVAAPASAPESRS